MNITITKKQIKRVAAIAAAAVAAGAVGITVALTSVRSNAAERQLPIYSVERGDKKISVTFDCAWENSNTDALIDILDDYDACATFFVTGDWCDRYPDDVKKLYDAGHEIENHSDQHPHVEGINVNDLINDTKECSRKIKMLTGEEPCLYRAPYGEYDDSLLTTLDGMGMKVIQWDVDSVDWKNPSSAEITKKVLDKTKSGSILLFHNDLDNTTAALPEILKKLKSDGYEFVGVKDLIYFDNYTIDPNGVQRQVSESMIDLADKDVEQVMAQYSEQLAAAGITEQQIEAAISAIREGNISQLPAELQPVAAQVMDKLENMAKSGNSADKGSSDNSGMTGKSADKGSEDYTGDTPRGSDISDPIDPTDPENTKTMK